MAINVRVFHLLIVWSCMCLLLLLQQAAGTFGFTSDPIVTSEKPNPCSNKDRIFAEYLHEIGSNGSIRIKICACNVLRDVAVVNLAETQELCQSSIFISQLKLEGNVSSSDHHCMLTEHINFNVSSYASATIHICPPTQSNTWTSSIPLHLPSTVFK